MYQVVYEYVTPLFYEYKFKELLGFWVTCMTQRPVLKIWMHMSEDKICFQDSCWSVGIIFILKNEE